MANYSIADKILSFGVFAALESRGDGHTSHWSLATTRYDPRTTSAIFTTYEFRGKWVYEKRTQDLIEMDRLVTLVQIGSLIDKLEVSDQYLDSLLCPNSLLLTILRDDPELNTGCHLSSFVWFLAAVRKLSQWGVFRVKHNSLCGLEKELVWFGVAREKQWKERYRI